MAIINNNVQNVKFLRNATPYVSRESALAGLNGFDLTSIEQDGTIILARYLVAGGVKTLAGLVYYADSDDKSITIIDVEGASADVEELRQEINNKLGTGVTSANTATAQLAALSGTSADGSGVTSVWGAKAYAYDLLGTLDGGVTAEAGYYVDSVSEVDGKISGSTKALPSVAAISAAGKAITAVSESNGTISATAGTIDAQYVTATGFTATNVQGALEELDGKIDDAIDALDYTGVTTGTGVYVTNVTEENGVINATTATLPTVDDSAVAKKFVIAVDETLGEISVERGSITSDDKTVVLGNADDGGVDFSVNIDNDTLHKDENGVISVASAALTQYVGDEDTIHISDVDANNEKTISSYLTIQKVTTGLSAEVKEEYRLVGHSGTTIGEPVKIYKDSHIVSIKYITDESDPKYQNLEYKYIDASGNTQTTYVDMSELVIEAEFASGVTVTDGVAHGVVDPTSESFLTVGANGFKLDGVQNAINSAIDALDATGGTQTIATGKHVAVEVIEKDGLITAVTVAEDDIASATALTKEISDRTSGDTELSNRLGNGVTTANTATAQLVALSGDPATAQSGDTSVEGAKKYADAKLSKVVADLDADVSGNSTHVTVNVVEENGVITDVNVEESNIANADDLATLSGKTITGVTSTNNSISASISNGAGNKTVNIETDASKIKMSGFTANTADSSLSAITTDSSVADAASKIVEEIISNEADVTEELNKLDGRLDVIESGYVETVKVNNVALAEENNAVNVQIIGASSAMTGSNAVIVETNNSTGAVTIGLGTIDCGTY